MNLFLIILESGCSRTRAVCYNALSSLAAVPGALIAYFLLPSVQGIVPYLLCLSAASFVYIALADLVPGRRTVSGIWNLAGEIVLITLGVGAIFGLR